MWTGATIDCDACIAPSDTTNRKQLSCQVETSATVCKYQCIDDTFIPQSQLPNVQVAAGDAFQGTRGVRTRIPLPVNHWCSLLSARQYHVPAPLWAVLPQEVSLGLHLTVCRVWTTNHRQPSTLLR